MTQPPPRRNWFVRNWKWVVPVGCLLPLLSCAGIMTLAITLAFGAIKSSDPYKMAVSAAKASPAVTAALGSPVEPGLLVTGQINVDGSSGNAELAIPISGPKGKGTIHIVGQKSAGKWSYTTLELEVKGSSQRVPLLPPEQ